MYREQSNDLQRTFSHLIDRKLHNATLALERILLSTDANGHPGELYGVDGEIFYRKHGGVGQELGTGGGTGLWESPGAVTKLINSQRIDLYDNLHFVGYQILSWEYGGLTVGQIYGFHGMTWQDFMIETKNSGVLSILSSAGYVDFNGGKVSDIGAPASTNDAVRVDSALHVPLIQMALTSKGSMFAGNGTSCGVLGAGTDTHVLTLDSSVSLGVKWAVAGGGGLWTSNVTHAWLSVAKDINLQTKSLVGVDEIHISRINVNSNIVFDNGIDKVIINRNSGTGDLEFSVADGDAFVFKTVT